MGRDNIASTERVFNNSGAFEGILSDFGNISGMGYTRISFLNHAGNLINVSIISISAKEFMQFAQTFIHYAK